MHLNCSWCSFAATAARILAVLMLIIIFPTTMYVSPLDRVRATSGDFSVSTNSAMLNLNSVYGNIPVELTSSGGFSDNVYLTATVSPTRDVNVTIGPSSVIVPVPSQIMPSVQFICGPNADGLYTVTITGTSNGLVHSITVQVMVDLGPNILLNTASPNLNILPGSTGTSTITVFSQKGFQGSVDFTPAETVPSIVNGPNGTLQLSMLTVPAGGSASTTLTVSSVTNTPPGIYDIILGTTSTGILHSLHVRVTVSLPSNAPDFAIWASIPTLRITPNSTDYSRIMVRSFNQYTGTVLVAGNSSLALQVYGTSVEVPVPGWTFSSLLTIIASPSTPVGNYTVNITGTSLGSTVTHTSTIRVEVTWMPTLNVIIDPGYVAVRQNDSSSIIVSVRSLNGQTGSLSVTNPSLASNNHGLSFQFYGSFDRVGPASDAIASLHIIARNTTLVGTYPVSFQFSIFNPTNASAVSPVTMVIFVYVVDSSTSTNGLGFLYLDAYPDDYGFVAQGSSLNFTISGIETLHAYGRLKTFIDPQRSYDSFGKVLIVYAPTSLQIGKYDVWLVGTTPDGSSNTLQLQVTVAPFEVRVYPATLNITPSKDATATVTIFNSDNYTGKVDLGTKVEPYETATIIPTTVYLSTFKPEVNATLTVHALHNPSFGTGNGGTQYTVTVQGFFTGPDGTLSYDKSVRVEYNQPAAAGLLPCVWCNLPPWQTGLIVAVLTGLFVTGMIRLYLSRNKHRQHLRELGSVSSLVINPECLGEYGHPALLFRESDFPPRT